ncbi:MAG TPA: DUF3443 family protein [Steroidobacteraceae bacterium]|nr:DUF3443 family protein [Steroidobacteraceae bacterium]
MRANLFAALIGMLCVAGCGGGGGFAGGGSGGGGTPTGGNVQAVTVDSGPTVIANSTTPAVNTIYTTVTICSPGSTTNCQTIDHIQVDTASSGLRIVAPQVLSITLPLQTDANNNVLAECTQFVDGSSWGPIRQADVKIGGETALKQEVQIIGDPAYPPQQGICNGATENDVPHFGANGILGVGPFIQDCGSGCTVQGHAVYFTCPTPTTCADSGVPLNLQVSNPVASFTTDNNGVIIQLPSVATSGSGPISGSLIFGIGTQSNNALGSAKVLFVDTANGFFSTKYKLSSGLTQSFIDSGSNAYYFPDSSINPCTTNVGFFCPPSVLALSGIMVSPINGTNVSVNFNVTSADNLFKSGSPLIAAAPALAGDSTQVGATSTGDGTSTFNGSNSFDWGMPFYYGRSVYTAIEGKNTSGGMGPYFAF